MTAASTDVRYGAATALYDAIYLSAQAVDRRQGRKVMVIITDGGDTVSRVDYKEAVRAAQEAEAIVYSIIVVPIEASAGRDTRRRACPHPDLGRYRRQVFLCHFSAATR